MTPTEKQILENKLQRVSNLLQKQYTQLRDAISEAQPIAEHLGFSLDPITGKLISKH